MFRAAKTGSALILALLGGASALTAQGQDSLRYVVWARDSSVTRDSMVTHAKAAGFAIFQLDLDSYRIAGLVDSPIEDSLIRWRDSLRWLRRVVRDKLTILPRDTSEAFAVAQSVDVPYHLSLIGADKAWAAGFTGQGQVIGFLDSGWNLGQNPDVRIAGGRNYVVGNTDSLDISEVPPCNGHGSHVVGTGVSTLWGVAPGASAFIAKVFQDIGGSCGSYMSNQYAAFVGLRNHGVLIASISIANSGTASYYEDGLNTFVAAGGVICAAGGNFATTPLTYPAQSPATVAVTSVGPSLYHSGFANTGAKLALAGMGESIPSDAPNGGVATKTGTSMVAPQCGGAEAVVRSAGAVGDASTTLLLATAQPLGDSTIFGKGLMRVDRAVAEAKGGVIIPGPATRTYATARLDTLAILSSRPWTVTSLHNTARKVGDLLILDVHANDSVTVIKQ